ncbi:MAG: hypothetical protein U0231_18925 [Nitrospiraceae bacterium]
MKDNDLVSGVFGLNAYRHMALGGTGFAGAYWMGRAAEFLGLYRRHAGLQEIRDDSTYS